MGSHQARWRLLSRRRKGWWIALGIVAGLIAVAVVVVAVLFLTREQPGARSIEDAIDDFRAGDDGRRHATQPPSGVYTLAGEGRGELSFPALHQDDGDEMPMTITSIDSECWTMRIDYNEAHWQEIDLCLTDDGIVETGGRSGQRWDLGATSFSNLTTFVCDPPAMFAMIGVDPGTSVSRSCSGTNDSVDGTTTSEGPVTFVGGDSITVSGEDLDAWHFRHEREMSGAQAGTEMLDFWLAAENFLPLRAERSIEVETDSPVGAVTYTERGSWTIVSLAPQR